MIWQGMPFIILFTGTIICVGVVILTWIRRSTPEAMPFTWMMMAIAEWSISYAFELNAPNLLTKILWAKIEYLGIVILPVAWFSLSCYFNNYRNLIQPKKGWLFSIIPIMTIIMVWTNDRHHFFWSRFELGNSFLLKNLIAQHNWWFWIHTGYSYILLLIGSCLFLRAVIRYPDLRGKVGTILAGVFLPWIANALYILDFKPFADFDLTPFAFTITGLIIATNFLHFNLIEVVPVARYAIVENMSDMVMVIDLQHRVVDLNPAALKFVSHSTSEIIGQPVEKVLTAWPELLRGFPDQTETEVVLIGDEGENHFDYRVSSLQNHKGRLTGRLIILRDITERKRAEKLQSSLGKLQKAMEEMVQAMAVIVEIKDSYTAGHQRRVAKLAQAIGEKMGLYQTELEAIYLAAIIHDIGKIYVPSEILNKPGRLTVDEFSIIKTHPELGYNILKTIDFPWPIAQMVQQHHERVNGSGYPLGLTRSEILLGAKIIAVADVVESMSNARPYRPALGVDQAIAEISKNRAILYEPQVVDCCIAVLTAKDFDYGLPLIS